jgi:hypothetical protein
MTELTVKELESAFSELSRCCLHSPVWTPVDVDSVLCCLRTSYSGWQQCGTDRIGESDGESYTVVKLKNSTFGLLSESADYTGHGCQCGAATSAYDNVRDLLSLGVVESEARELIVRLLAVPGSVVTDAGGLEAGRAS